MYRAKKDNLEKLKQYPLPPSNKSEERYHREANYDSAIVVRVMAKNSMGGYVGDDIYCALEDGRFTDQFYYELAKVSYSLQLDDELEKKHAKILLDKNYIWKTQDQRIIEMRDLLEEINLVKNSNNVSFFKSALKELFGVTSSSDKVKTAKDKLSSVWFEQSFQNEKDTVHVVFTKTQSLDNKENIEGCHNCGVAIGAITYKLIDNQWQIVSKQKNIGVVGSWGEAPKIKQANILKLSPNNTAFLINDSFDGQGVTEEWTDIFSFYKNSWLNLGDIATGGDNSGNCGEGSSHNCSSYKGKISVIMSKKEYPDLLVTKTGTEVVYQDALYMTKIS